MPQPEFLANVQAAEAWLMESEPEESKDDVLLFEWPIEVNGTPYARYQRQDGTRYWKAIG